MRVTLAHWLVAPATARREKEKQQQGGGDDSSSPGGVAVTVDRLAGGASAEPRGVGVVHSSCLRPGCPAGGN